MKNKIAYTLLSPFIIYNLIFWLFPFVWGGYISLTEYDFINEPFFVGFENYIDVITSQQFWKTMLITLKLFILLVPSVTLTSLGLALMLSRVKRFRGFYIVGFLSVYTVSGVAYSLIFQMFLSDTGSFNLMLYKYFDLRIPWLTNDSLVLVVFVILITWKMIGYYALIFLASLEALPQEIYDNAKIEGASAIRRFFSITLPLINPSIIVVLVFATILSFNIFTEPFLLTNGGPAGASSTFMFIIYQHVFAYQEVGYGSSVVVLSALASFIAIFVIRKVMEKDVVL